ncbi:hypothetical protein SDC9_147157 [bioreactor metagenome]|uniref:Uncharacterized protein n=1 Tax=bioreactor metagenome TaxID=1076179 RepID=A0A645EH96_9ZZZZ
MFTAQEQAVCAVAPACHERESCVSVIGLQCAKRVRRDVLNLIHFIADTLACLGVGEEDFAPDRELVKVTKVRTAFVVVTD